MAANTQPIWTKVGKTQWGTVTIANTAKDGTGTVVPVFTAGLEGSLVKKLLVNSLGTNVATALRVWLNNGSSNATPANNTLLGSYTIAATTLSEVAALLITEITLDIAIPAGYVINITIGTTVAAGLHVAAIGGDY
jgi:hypothetical protein